MNAFTTSGALADVGSDGGEVALIDADVWRRSKFARLGLRVHFIALMGTVYDGMLNRCRIQFSTYIASL
jgi:hypothetical protein